MGSPCGAPILWGISPDFSGLSPCYRWIAYVLLTRAPVAGKGIATSPLPLDLHVLGLSLAFILSQDQTLRCIFSFSLLYLRSVTWPNWLLSLFFSCTTLASSISFNELGKKFPGACPVSSFAVAKLMHFPFSLQIFFHFFMLYNITFLQQTVLHDFIIKHFFQKKSHYLYR